MHQTKLELGTRGEEMSPEGEASRQRWEDSSEKNVGGLLEVTSALGDGGEGLRMG